MNKKISVGLLAVLLSVSQISQAADGSKASEGIDMWDVAMLLVGAVTLSQLPGKSTFDACVDSCIEDYERDNPYIRMNSSVVNESCRTACQ